MKHTLLLLFFSLHILAAEPEFPLTADSKPQAEVAKGTLIKDSYTAPESSVFPGTVREYQIYLPAGFDKAQPAHFMVFQDGVIYQAPVVFDNLIAKKDIPSLVGIFIKPGVVPAANDQALPRFNRSYEYDSITPTYSKFLIEEFLPALEKKHAISLSQDPNHAAISGNSSGGICAFMVAWHRPDRFRRVFTGVGTYVGIHGADQLPVLVRKIEPKPLRIYLQSGTGDNNLYCGDWWMANQMMERSLTWAGYDVNHAWGEGGHNQKHASQIFPDVLRWLWRDWQTDIEVKANPKGESKWKGYEVCVGNNWVKIEVEGLRSLETIKASVLGDVIGLDQNPNEIVMLANSGAVTRSRRESVTAFACGREGTIYYSIQNLSGSKENDVGNFKLILEQPNGTSKLLCSGAQMLVSDILVKSTGEIILLAYQYGPETHALFTVENQKPKQIWPSSKIKMSEEPYRITFSPDQSLIYVRDTGSRIRSYSLKEPPRIACVQDFFILNNDSPNAKRAEDWPNGYSPEGACVDTEGRLYVATTLGIQVCDQAGRVNFIIPTPKPAHDVCFGGKDLSELFIACGDTIYKRPTKVHGVVSGQQAPIKPAPPKL